MSNKPASRLMDVWMLRRVGYGSKLGVCETVVFKSEARVRIFAQQFYTEPLEWKPAVICGTPRGWICTVENDEVTLYLTCHMLEDGHND